MRYVIYDKYTHKYYTDRNRYWSAAEEDKNWSEDINNARLYHNMGAVRQARGWKSGFFPNPEVRTDSSMSAEERTRIYQEWRESYVRYTDETRPTVAVPVNIVRA